MKISSRPSKTCDIRRYGWGVAQAKHGVQLGDEQRPRPGDQYDRDGPIHRVLEEQQHAVGEALPVFFVFPFSSSDCFCFSTTTPQISDSAARSGSTGASRRDTTQRIKADAGHRRTTGIDRAPGEIGAARRQRSRRDRGGTKAAATGARPCPTGIENQVHAEQGFIGARLLRVSMTWRSSIVDAETAAMSAYRTGHTMPNACGGGWNAVTQPRVPGRPAGRLASPPTVAVARTAPTVLTRVDRDIPLFTPMSMSFNRTQDASGVI